VTSLVVALTTFAVILLAELPDKTALASLVLGTRYRSWPVLSGIAAGFTVHVVLAVAAGSLLGLLPHRVLQIVTATLFLITAGFLFFRKPPSGEQEEPHRDAQGFWPVAATGFVVILVAEFGDLTQLVTANLAAKYHDPLTVGLGAVLGLWAVAALAIAGGRSLLKVIPISVITRVAAGIMAVLATISIVGAIHG
jgi:putative Ca2+/H+ antiporter (TMEM165/GDT1 family)